MKAIFSRIVDEGFSPSEILQQANVEALENPTCQDRLPSDFDGWVMDIHICSDNTVAQTCNVSHTENKFYPF